MATITSIWDLPTYYFVGADALTDHQLVTLRRMVIRDQIGAPLRSDHNTSADTKQALVLLKMIGLASSSWAGGTHAWQATGYGEKVVKAQMRLRGE